MCRIGTIVVFTSLSVSVLNKHRRHSSDVKHTTPTVAMKPRQSPFDVPAAELHTSVVHTGYDLPDGDRTILSDPERSGWLLPVVGSQNPALRQTLGHSRGHESTARVSLSGRLDSME
jgi:hypothetical protein